MRSKTVFLVAALFAAIPALSLYANPVTAWVPSYSIATCKTILEKDFGGVGMKDGLTYLPLQFYKPNGAALVKGGDFTDADIQWFITWGHKSNIKVLLCIYNYINDWDWSAARAAFQDNRSAFVKAVVAEVARTGLDGADVDFEGPDVSTSDRDAYIAFAKELCDSLHQRKKIVTIASFPSEWNAPNWDWWAPLYTTAKVDGICTMGYDWSGRNKDYATQTQHASAGAAKFMIGMPGWVGSWQSNTVVEQLNWVISDGDVSGMGIWDASLTHNDGTPCPEWRTAEVWNKIKQIRSKNATATTAPVLTRATTIEIGAMSVLSNRVSVALHMRSAGHATVRIHDLQGKPVAELFSGTLQNGRSLTWDGRDERGLKAPCGTYVLAVSTNSGVVSKGFVLAR